MTGRLSASGPVLAGVAALVLLVAGVGGWGATTRIAGAIIAAGKVAVPEDHHVIQHQGGGTLAERHVSRGDRIEKGAPILRLDDTALRARKALLVSERAEIMARIARLEAERDDADALTFDPALADAAVSDTAAADAIEGQRQLHDRRRDVLEQERHTLELRRTQMTHQLEGARSAHSALDLQHRLITAELATQRTLREKGLTNEAKVRALEREQARISGEIGRLEAEQTASEARMSELRIETALLQHRRAEEAQSALRELRPRLVEVEAQRDELRRRIERKTLRAPADGIVHDIAATSPNAVIGPGDAVASIVPLDRPLIVRARIAPDDIDELHIGQTAALHFPAFGMRETPPLEGTVTTISPDANSDHEGAEHYFAAEIAIPPEELEKLGTRELRPGMRAEARIRTRTRTPLTYLLDPVAVYFTRALRAG